MSDSGSRCDLSLDRLVLGEGRSRATGSVSISVRPTRRPRWTSTAGWRCCPSDPRDAGAVGPVLRPDGEFLVGEAAEQRGAADPARLVREFKRRIGDPVPILVGGSPSRRQALTARLLAWVVEAATQRQGGPPEHVAYPPGELGAVQEGPARPGARLAGCADGDSCCAEPEAAACLRLAEPCRRAMVAVYDLGGGTFDAAVLATARASRCSASRKASNTWAASTSTRRSSATS